MPLSYSQLQTYRTCPRQYEYAFVKKLDRPLSAEESFGSSMHNTLKKWGEREKEGSRQKAVISDQLHLFTGDTPQQDSDFCLLTSDHLHSLWHQSFIVEGYASRIEADFQRKVGEQILQHFFAWWEQESRVVVGVESSFKYQLGDGSETLTGRLDRVERTLKGLRIIDFKTGQPRTQEQCDSDLQLSIYALAAKQIYEEPVDELILLFLNEEGITERRTHRNESQLRDAEKSITSLITRIREKDFAPTPSFPVCSRCPYKGICDVAAA